MELVTVADRQAVLGIRLDLGMERTHGGGERRDSRADQAWASAFALACSNSALLMTPLAFRSPSLASSAAVLLPVPAACCTYERNAASSTFACCTARSCIEPPRTMRYRRSP